MNSGPVSSWPEPVQRSTVSFLEGYLVMGTSDEANSIDASTFQKPLKQIAEVLAQKLKREAPKLLAAPGFVAVDLHVLMRQAMYTYDLLFYLNADERRETDPYWRNVYTIVALPLVRNMIDCLYNVTAILQDPAGNGTLWRESGFRKAYTDIDDTEKRYGGKPGWDEWIRKNREALDLGIRACGLTVAGVQAQKARWPTLGKYIGNKQTGGTLTPHQDFLKTFMYGNWSKYSAIAHGAFEGLLEVAPYYTEDSLDHDFRKKLDESHPDFMTKCLAEAAAVLLCMVTELQAHFHFDDDGARINDRIHAMWNALMPVFEVKELYKERYAKLMKDRGILVV
jgi:hypothetical protein